MKEYIEIKTDYIELDKFLKWIGIASTGGEAKILIKDGQIKLNGLVEKRRSKKLYPGDEIIYNDKEFVIAKGREK